MNMSDNGLITIESAFSVSETIDRLASAIAPLGLTVFGSIDHASGAATVGLLLRPTRLLIFGNPKGGTPLMQDHKAPASIFRLRRWAGRTPTARFG
jgi:uncharacterized protein (DUF302 family)